MEINLSINHSEKNKVDKYLTDITKIEATLKESTSIIKPSLTLRITNPSNFNYVEIPSFGRSYFITDIVAVNNNLWLIDCIVDPLQSHSTEIKDLIIILSDTEDAGNDLYLQNNSWMNKCKDTTSIINFPSGLLDNGEYILITAGG